MRDCAVRLNEREAGRNEMSARFRVAGRCKLLSAPLNVLGKVVFEEPEMDLLEVLSGCESAYCYFEKFVFLDDRQRALQSMQLMRAEGMIEMTFDGQPVETWRLSAWRRDAGSADTNADLQRVSLYITRKGSFFYWGR